jgi:hypothetical protein
MPLIAGHDFQDTSAGRVCSCGVRWVSIANATKADLNQLHVAHAGTLNERELAEIEAERARIWDAVADIGSAARAS